MEYIVFESKIVEAKAKAELKKISDDLFVKVGRSNFISTEGARQIIRIRIHSSEFRNEDLKDLKHFPELKLLEIFSFGLTDLQNLPALERLETLCIRTGENPPIDPAPLTKCRGLKKLDLEGQRFTDLRPIAELKKLRSLNLSWCGIDDLRFLQNLTSLTELKLHANPIDDISMLAGLKRLKTLHLSDGLIGDLSVIADLEKLEELRFGCHQITDTVQLRSLAFLENLRHYVDKTVAI